MSIEQEIMSDPTLRFILRESKMSYDLIDHQIDIRKAAFIIALNRHIDSVINYSK